MIRGELFTVVSLFAAGAVAGIAATFLLALGKGSRGARAVFDFLTPPIVGAIFFFALMLSSDGEIRWYAFVAFALGGTAQRLLHKKLSPFLCRIAKKLILPIKSLTESLESALKKLFARRKNT